MSAFENSGFSVPFFAFASESAQIFFHASDLSIFEPVDAAEAVVEMFRMVRVDGRRALSMA